MPRCLMPKKWKTAVANECSWDYDGRRPPSPPQQQQQPAKSSGPQWEPPVTVLLHHHQHHIQQQHHHHAWGPSSPPAGATAPSPPPCCTGTAFHYLTGTALATTLSYRSYNNTITVTESIIFLVFCVLLVSVNDARPNRKIIFSHGYTSCG